MVPSCVGFISKHFSFNCTTKPDDFTASYKFRSLKHFLSSGDFKPLNERVQQINVKLANGLYCRPVQQYKSDFSMTNEVHDTNLILLMFLNIKKKGIFH